MLWSKAFALAAVVLLAACGYTPIYGERGELPRGAQTQLANVQVLPIEERVGQMLRNVLLDQMNPGGMSAKPLYRLTVRLTEQSQELSVQKTQFATHANLTLLATYTLTRIADGHPVYSGNSTMISSYNIVDQPYATLAAEADARARAVRELGEDITQRVGAYFVNSGTASR
jgi:LPS-assembly lipoprotein